MAWPGVPAAHAACAAAGLLRAWGRRRRQPGPRRRATRQAASSPPCQPPGSLARSHTLLPCPRPHPPLLPRSTLIDVHGKMGNWEEAVGVLAAMKGEGVEPVLRTFK